MSTRTFLSILTFLGAALGLTAIASAAEKSPSELLKESVSEVLDVLHSTEAQSVEEKRAKVLDLLESRFSFDIIIRRALGRNWNKLDEQQQERITVLITDLLIRAYTRELESGLRPQINFTKTEELSPNKIEVTSTVTYRDSLVTVSYRLAKITNRGWQIYDVLVEGVSMVSNYRKQFDDHFQTKSAEALLKLLEAKLKDFDVEVL